MKIQIELIEQPTKIDIAYTHAIQTVPKVKTALAVRNNYRTVWASSTYALTGFLKNNNL